MSNNLISLAGWYFLPSLVTGYIQTACYAIFIRAGDPKPQPGSPRHTSHRRKIQILVILAYLLYTIYEADYQLLEQKNFYTLLDVPHHADERYIQSKFRRLGAKFHPDKAGNDGEREQWEVIYIRLKVARDTLIDPAKRFAYDRFGADILQWQNCKKIRDFIYTGLQQMSIYYIGSFVALAALGMLGYLRHGTFWRAMAVASLFVIELHTVTRPEYPWFLESLVNTFLEWTGLRTAYLPFQMIVLLRKCAITLFIAMSQLGPLLQSPQQAAKEAMSDGTGGVSQKQLDRMEALAKASDQEITKLIGLGGASGREPPVGLQEFIVLNTVRNDSEVKEAVGRALERKKRELEAQQNQTQGQAQVEEQT